MIRLTEFTARFLELSWAWLSDPETKLLTMTADFDRAGQQRFFASLPNRSDYRIWGVMMSDGHPIGAAGLKHIDGSIAEYWGYIGDKDCWGQGLGAHMLGAVEQKARELGIASLYLNVAADNRRAVALYKRLGFIVVDPTASRLVMTKEFAR